MSPLLLNLWARILDISNLDISILYVNKKIDNVITILTLFIPTCLKKYVVSEITLHAYFLLYKKPVHKKLKLRTFKNKETFRIVKSLVFVDKNYFLENSWNFQNFVCNFRNFVIKFI